MVLFMRCITVIVDRCCIRPCWSSGREVLFVEGKFFSSVFAMGDRSAIGLYDVPIDLSLLGLGIGIIFAVFQAEGIVFVFSAVLYMSVSVLRVLGV